VLFGAYDVATKILPVIEGAEEENSGHMRSDGNKALEAITGQSVGWPDNDQKDLTQEEIDAKAKWGAIVSQQASEFKRREEAREKARKKLTELLKNLDKKDAWKDALVEAPKVMKDAERDLGKH